VQKSSTLPIDLKSLSDDALLNDKEVAAALRISAGNLRNWRLQRRGPRTIALGRSVRYRVADLRAFLDAQTRDFTQQ
jgi:predicted DNA-binding transcriptional regulator AlpA